MKTYVINETDLSFSKQLPIVQSFASYKEAIEYYNARIDIFEKEYEGYSEFVKDEHKQRIVFFTDEDDNVQYLIYFVETKVR